MKYYSEVLKRTFDTEKECIEEEKAYEEKAAAKKAEQQALTKARKERAKEVETAYQEVIAARKRYDELRNKFVKDYGSWHMTISSQDDFENFNDIFDSFFRIF